MNQIERSSDSQDGAWSMRREFDRGFSKPAHHKTSTLQNYLGIRLGDDPYAIRVNDIAGLYADHPIMPLLSQSPSLLGLVGLRGQIVPAYDLASLYGYVRKTAPRWMILLRLKEPVALAFEHFDMHFSADITDIVPATKAISNTSDYAKNQGHDAVYDATTIRPIIQLQSLPDPIRRTLTKHT
jgi:purine-binding chemotaxis protein CheW